MKLLQKIIRKYREVFRKKAQLNYDDLRRANTIQKWINTLHN